MIHSKESLAEVLPYVSLITKLLTCFNVKTVDEMESPTNQRITYTTFREIKFIFKHLEVQEDSTSKE